MTFEDYFAKESQMINLYSCKKSNRPKPGFFATTSRHKQHPHRTPTRYVPISLFGEAKMYIFSFGVFSSFFHESPKIKVDGYFHHLSPVPSADLLLCPKLEPIPKQDVTLVQK